MTEQTAIWVVVVGLTTLIGLYTSFKKVLSDPISKLSEDLRTQHEDFALRITEQGARSDKAIEAIEKAQDELKELSKATQDNTVRIVVLEQKIDKK